MKLIALFTLLIPLLSEDTILRGKDGGIEGGMGGGSEGINGGSVGG